MTGRPGPTKATRTLITGRPGPKETRTKVQNTPLWRRFALAVRTHYDQLRAYVLGTVSKPSPLIALSPFLTTKLLGNFEYTRALTLQAYHFFNQDYPSADKEFNAEMLARAVDFGYVRWPRIIQGLIRDKDVLDVGCDNGFRSLGYVIVGARTYTAFDPQMKLDLQDPRNPRTGKREIFGWTPRQVMAQFSRVKLARNSLASADAQTFDVAILHNTAGRLLNLDEVFLAVATQLRPDGRLVLKQDIDSWRRGGRTPKANDGARPGGRTPKENDGARPTDIRLDSVEGPFPHRFDEIRLDDLRAIVDRYYDVEVWVETPCSKRAARANLTEALVARVPHLTRRDLEIDNVFCVAKRIREIPSNKRDIVLVHDPRLIFHDNKPAALQAYFLFNQSYPLADKEFNADVIGHAVDFGYLQWPRRIREYVQGKDVLDVGCGSGIHSIGYAVVGVRSYTGMDPVVKLDSDRAKNLRTREWESFGWTPRQIMAQFSRIELFPGTSEEFCSGRTFDVAILHNVTEHLIDIEAVFRSTAARLRGDGCIIFNHHNFYCWNGHHLQPKTIDQIKPGDPEQKQYMDWAHIRFEPPEGHFFHRGLNKIKLDDLKSLVQRDYNIDVWEEIPSDEWNGGKRLTEEIVLGFPELTHRDLAIHNVFCLARKKSAPS